MTNSNTKFDIIRENQTLAHCGDIGTDGLIARLTDWDDLYGIMLSDVSYNRVRVTLDKVPEDIDSFAAAVYSHCPDVVDQHFLSFTELAEENPNPNYAKCIEGLDELDDDFGLKVMKRWIKLERTLPLWWD